MRIPRSYIWSGYFMLVPLCTGGCTVAGMSAAYSMKDLHKTETRIDGAELRDLPEDSRVRVDLFGGGSEYGRLRGFLTETDSLYSSRYEAFRDSIVGWMPSRGEAIVVRGRSDFSGAFRSFDFDGIHIDGRETGIGLRNVFSVDAADESVDGVSGVFLSELSSEGRIPYQSSLRLEDSGDAITIQTDGISSAYWVQSAWWVFVPVAVGLVVDAAIIFSVDWGG